MRRYAFYGPNRTNEMKTHWRNSEEQHYSQKRMNLNSNIKGKSFTRTWRRKPECEQKKSDDTVQSRYFSTAEDLKEEERTNTTYSEHDSTKIIRKETGKLDLLIEDELHEWAL